MLAQLSNNSIDCLKYIKFVCWLCYAVFHCNAVFTVYTINSVLLCIMIRPSHSILRVSSQTKSSSDHRDKGQSSSDRRRDQAGTHSTKESSHHKRSGRSPDSKRRKLEEDRYEQRGKTMSHDADRLGERSERRDRSGHYGHRSYDDDHKRHHEAKADNMKPSSTELVGKDSSHRHDIGREVVLAEEVWLCRDLVVKIVDRQYKKGRHYNAKVCRS